MLNELIITILSTKVGWVIGGIAGLVMAMFALYYILFAILMIGGTAISMVKILTENYSLRNAAYDTAWNGAELGVTMPDGGEPVKKEKEEKES